jgi:hypothetical protein
MPVSHDTPGAELLGEVFAEAYSRVVEEQAQLALGHRQASVLRRRGRRTSWWPCALVEPLDDPPAVPEETKQPNSAPEAQVESVDGELTHRQLWRRFGRFTALWVPRALLAVAVLIAWSFVEDWGFDKIGSWVVRHLGWAD